MANDNYLGNPLLKATNVPVNFTKEQIEEYVKCSSDPVYFMEHYIKIVSLDEGLVPFEMYDFQKEIVNTIHNNRFTICKIPRQSGKSTCVVSYLLHYCLFNPNAKVALLANKGDTAKDMLNRFKTAYENLPKWMQQGIVEWNKFSIVLENGAKIVSAATSSSAVRGGSYNVIVLDEFAYVPNNIAENFFSSVYPTITSGKSTKVVVISTPKGLNHYYKMWVNAQNKKNEYIPVEAHWYDVPGRDQSFKKQTIANTSDQQWRVEFECAFIGSEETLIAASRLASLVFTAPISSTPEGLDIYEPPMQGHVYTILVDTARGIEGDFHAFSVIDCTAPVYKQVAKFKNNLISHQLYPNIIKKVATMYNESFVLFELNDLGQTVAELMHDELEYGNIIAVSNRGKKGQQANGGFGGGKLQYGVTVSYQIKKVGCSILKDMIEGEKLIISDFDTISELSTYIAKGQGYEATEGYHDDLVSSLVLFGWLSTQPFYKDYTNTDVRKRLYEAQLQKIEDEVMPFGFFDNGMEDGPTQEDIDIFDDRPDTEKKKRSQSEFNW